MCSAELTNGYGKRGTKRRIVSSNEEGSSDNDDKSENKSSDTDVKGKTLKKREPAPSIKPDSSDSEDELPIRLFSDFSTCLISHAII